MFVQKCNDHWLLLEWKSDGGPIRPVILARFNDQQTALDEMAMRRERPQLADVPQSQRGFGQ